MRDRGGGLLVLVHRIYPLGFSLPLVSFENLGHSATLHHFHLFFLVSLSSCAAHRLLGFVAILRLVSALTLAIFIIGITTTERPHDVCLLKPQGWPLALLIKGAPLLAHCRKETNLSMIEKVGWSSISNQLGCRLMLPFCKSYKFFKDHFFCIHCRDVGPNILVDSIGQPRFPFYWTKCLVVTIKVERAYLEEWEDEFISDLRGRLTYSCVELIQWAFQKKKALPFTSTFSSPFVPNVVLTLIALPAPNLVLTPDIIPTPVIEVVLVVIGPKQASTSSSGEPSRKRPCKVI
ncbi:hypothetical protein CR513_14882, partial [Mucuna pruriens]